MDYESKIKMVEDTVDDLKHGFIWEICKAEQHIYLEIFLS